MLGQAATETAAGIPIPGHPIPYSYTQSEINDFMAVYSKDPVVSGYLWNKTPPYGVIFTPPTYGQLLLWFDASGVFHIVDVTNMSIVEQVQKPPYESPDPGFIQGVIDQVTALVQSLPSPQQALTGALTAAEVGIAFVVIYMLYQIMR